MPLLLSLRRLLLGSAKRFYEHNCTHLAAAISYYILFSLFPLFIFTAAVLGLFLTDVRLREELVSAVMDYVPLDEREGRRNLAEAIDGAAGVTSSTIGAVGLFVMIWSASSIFGAVRHALDRIFVVGTSRHVVHQKLRDVAMVPTFAPFFVASIAMTGALGFARHAISGFPVLGSMSWMDFIWPVAAAVLSASLSFLAFFGIYFLVPAKHPRPRDIWPGALVATLIFESSKFVFVLYLDQFTSYDVVFGALGTVAAFIFWVYFSANVMLFGAEVAATVVATRRPTLRLANGPEAESRSAAER